MSELNTTAATLANAAQIIECHHSDSHSVEQAAAILGVESVTVHKYCSAGKIMPTGNRMLLESYKLSGKKWIPRKALLEFVAAQQRSAKSA